MRHRPLHVSAEILSKGFGMRVIGYDPYVTKEAMEQMGYEKYDEVNELIRNADIINVSVLIFYTLGNFIKQLCVPVLHHPEYS